MKLGCRSAKEGASEYGDEAVVEVDAVLKPAPGAAWAAAIHEEVGAVFMRVFDGGADAGPVVVGDDVAEGDVGAHEVGGEAGGFINGEADVVAAMLTHFDDAVVVPRAVEVGVLALLTAGEVLDPDIVLDGEVPGEEADTVAADTLGGAEGTALQGEGVVVGITAVVLGAVDGDVARLPWAGRFCARRCLRG